MDAIGLSSRKAETIDILQRIYNLFMKTDASMIEINPLAEDTFGTSAYRGEPGIQWERVLDMGACRGVGDGGVDWAVMEDG